MTGSHTERRAAFKALNEASHAALRAHIRLHAESGTDPQYLTVLSSLTSTCSITDMLVDQL